MHSKVFFTIPLLFASALGAAVNEGSSITNTKTACVTRTGTKSLKSVPTSSSTSTQVLPPNVITKTSRTTVKVTPKAKTITVTKVDVKKVTTTLLTITKPLTTTVIQTNTVTSTNFQTATSIISTEVSSSTTVTSTIPTSSGFLNIVDSAPLVLQPTKREVSPLLQRGNKEGCTGVWFPASVTCNTVLQIKAIITTTVQGSPVTITVPAPLLLSTTTITSTKTETQLLAKATSTVTQTSTITTTMVEVGTTTSVSTTTSTVVSSTTVTSYAACSTNNIISSYNGIPVDSMFNNGANTVSTFDLTAASSAEACCIECQTVPTTGTKGCQGYFFYQNCILLYSRLGVCSTSANAGFFTTKAGSQSYNIGNGPCGYFTAQS